MVFKSNKVKTSVVKVTNEIIFYFPEISTCKIVKLNLKRRRSEKNIRLHAMCSKETKSELKSDNLLSKFNFLISAFLS